MLRKLIGRPVIAVVMATIGLASILRGLGPFTIFSGTRPLPLPIRDEPFMLGPLFIPPIQILGAGVSLAFLAGFGWFFLRSRKGIAMRAVADNQQVAMAMGIDVERYFGVAWAMTGIVSALGGILFDGASHPVCTENRDAAFWNLVDFVDEMRAFGAQPIDDVAIMNDLMADVDRRSIFLQRPLDDLDRAFDPGAKTSRLG